MTGWYQWSEKYLYYAINCFLIEHLSVDEKSRYKKKLHHSIVKLFIFEIIMLFFNDD